MAIQKTPVYIVLKRYLPKLNIPNIDDLLPLKHVVDNELEFHLFKEVDSKNFNHKWGVVCRRRLDANNHILPKWIAAINNIQIEKSGNENIVFKSYVNPETKEIKYWLNYIEKSIDILDDYYLRTLSFLDSSFSYSKKLHVNIQINNEIIHFSQMSTSSDHFSIVECENTEKLMENIAVYPLYNFMKYFSESFTLIGVSPKSALILLVCGLEVFLHEYFEAKGMKMNERTTVGTLWDIFRDVELKYVNIEDLSENILDKVKEAMTERNNIVHNNKNVSNKQVEDYWFNAQSFIKIASRKVKEEYRALN